MPNRAAHVPESELGAAVGVLNARQRQAFRVVALASLVNSGIHRFGGVERGLGSAFPLALGGKEISFVVAPIDAVRPAGIGGCCVARNHHNRLHCCTRSRLPASVAIYKLHAGLAVVVGFEVNQDLQFIEIDIDRIQKPAKRRDRNRLDVDQKR